MLVEGLGRRLPTERLAGPGVQGVSDGTTALLLHPSGLATPTGIDSAAPATGSSTPRCTEWL